MRTILVLLALILFPALAFGQAEILTSSTATVALAPGGGFDPGMLSGIISALGAAFHDKDWSMLVGIILGAAVLIARFIIGDLKKAEADRKIPKAAIPFIVAGLSLLGAVSVVRRASTRSCTPARVRSADTSIPVDAVKLAPVVLDVVTLDAIAWYVRL